MPKPNPVAARRLKTYTAETGCVYEYYFVGKRTAVSDDPFAPATEYIFDIVSARNPKFAVSIFLFDSAVAAWQHENGRDLLDAERYAVAKRRLFRGFDRIAQLMENGRRLPVDVGELKEFLLELGVD